MDWWEVPYAVDDMVLRCAAPAADIRQQASDLFTNNPIGFYYHPYREKAAFFCNVPTRTDDLIRAQDVLERAVGRSTVAEMALTEDKLTTEPWVKVAYSHALRTVGEALNFFPGQYPGGIPNHASPLAAMLTTGLVGGGLGYGLGALGENVLPAGYGKNLRRSGALLGAGAGVAFPALWAAINHHHGKSVLDPWPMTGPATDSLTVPKEASLHPFYVHAAKAFVKKAFSGFGEYVGGVVQKTPTPYDVNVNALGQTLWEAGASPALAGTTMGALYAAQQLPDPNSRPGVVTGSQLGQLAMNAGRDYLTGAMVGAALNTIVGTPTPASSYGTAAAILGLVGSVVPKLFGR